jgi:hypothetical protein
MSVLADGGSYARSGVSSTAGSGTSTGAIGSGTSLGSVSGRSSGLSVSVMSHPYRDCVSRNRSNRAPEFDDLRMGPRLPRNRRTATA